MSRESANRFRRLGNVDAGSQKAYPDPDDVWYRLGREAAPGACGCLPVARDDGGASRCPDSPVSAARHAGHPGAAGVGTVAPGPAPITPSLTLTGEYNDNVFTDNH